MSSKKKKRTKQSSKMKKKEEFSDIMKDVQNIMDIYKISDKINGNKILGAGLLEPGINMNNANRNIMWCAHFAQTPVLSNSVKPEIPLVFTRFENQVGKYSSGYKQSDRKLEILAKIIKNPYKYYLIVQDENGVYDVIERVECVNRTENYGWKYNNFIDELDEGDIIDENDIICANTSYDEYMNLCYGINLRTVYYANRDKTHEDCALISESAAEKLKFNTVGLTKVTVNTNDILLNIYGDDKEYKCFPDIGEDIIDQQLCIRRKIDYDSILAELKDLTKYRNNDDVFYKKGKVIDIDVYSNANLEELRKLKYYSQIVKYIEMDKDFCESVVYSIEDIIKHDTDNCSTRLIELYNDCLMKIDENNYYTDDANEFDNIVIRFTTLYEKPILKGGKCTGRYGNKGIIGEKYDDNNLSTDDILKMDENDLELMIIPDNEMPIVESGKFKGLQAEICLNPLGVNNRKNYFQLFEQEINFIGLYVRKAIHEAEDLSDKREILFTFYEKLKCYELKETTKEFLDRLEDEEEYIFFEQLVEDGIPVHQGPFNNHIDIYDLLDIQSYYEENLGLEKFKFKGIHNPMVMGELYFIILKHSPDNKNSARSTKFMDLKDNPSKDRDYKQGKSLYSTNAVKLGRYLLIRF